ncbi:hypothetical protein [Ideonella sp. A 288]|uniref:hypothetical protein n=1 Tax=Ideonella sp. A 288 TaxID=1962181 RepID=UPI00118533BC|nr:hypothetical protein [Ideonella sp. A 288]
MSNESNHGLRFNDRACNGCGWQLRATRAQTWKLNGVVPLGSTAVYECAICGNRFRLRTLWHLLVLACWGSAMAWYLIGWPVSALEALVLVSFCIYCLFAIVEDQWGRRRNPRWDGPDSIDHAYAVPLPAPAEPPPAQPTPAPREVSPRQARVHAVGMIAVGVVVALIMVQVLPALPTDGRVAAMLRLPVLLAAALILFGVYELLFGLPPSKCVDLWLSFPGWVKVITGTVSTVAWVAMIIYVAAQGR